MPNKSLLVFLFFVLQFLNCSPKNRNSQKVRELNTSDTFLRYIPKDIPLRAIRDYERQLKLDSLDNGFDSVQIRVRYGAGLAGNDRMVILSNSNFEWTGTVLEIEHNYSATTGEFVSLSSANKFVNPISGWENFINKLFDQNILTLPDCSALPSFNNYTFADPDAVDVQIATKNAYRYYCYLNPYNFSDEYTEAKNILFILRTIEKEFDLKPMWEYELKK